MPRAFGEVGLKRTQFQFANVIRSLKVGGILVRLGYFAEAARVQPSVVRHARA
jgi:hypothetical protein